MFRLGYNTNGLAHHRVIDSLRLLAGLEYEALALTPDVGQLDPYCADVETVRRVRDEAGELGLEIVIETGARFLLDPARKHRPTLLEESSADRERRVDFLRRCIDLAADLGGDLVSLWAGAVPEQNGSNATSNGSGDRTDGPEELWDRLCQGLVSVLDHARESGVRIAFEPEPGMFIERPRGYEELVRRLGAAGSELGLCLDVGHLLCTNDLPVDRVIRKFSSRILHVHLDDIACGVHEHCMFGQGDLDLGSTLNALLEVGYDGVAAVELSRDSHRGAAAASEAMQHIQAALGL